MASEEAEAANYSSYADHTIAAFTTALASGAPAPGGGAAAALVAALAAALAEMMAQFTLGRPKYAEADERARAISARCEELRAALLEQMDADARAYQGVRDAYSRPRSTDDERAARDEAIQAALLAATTPPVIVMSLGREIVGLAGEIATIGNPSVASDAGCAALLADAATRCALLNVLANAKLIRDADTADGLREHAAALADETTTLAGQAVATVRERMGV